MIDNSRYTSVKEAINCYQRAVFILIHHHPYPSRKILEAVPGNTFPPRFSEERRQANTLTGAPFLPQPLGGSHPGVVYNTFRIRISAAILAIILKNVIFQMFGNTPLLLF